MRLLSALHLAAITTFIFAVVALMLGKSLAATALFFVATAGFLATKDGDVTLLRLIPEYDPDAPHIVDWQSSNNPKVRQIQEQTQLKPLPVYVRRRPSAWEYMGRFRVTHVATDAKTLAEREARAEHIVSYAIYLERC